MERLGAVIRLREKGGSVWNRVKGKAGGYEALPLEIAMVTVVWPPE